MEILKILKNTLETTNGTCLNFPLEIAFLKHDTLIRIFLDFQKKIEIHDFLGGIWLDPI